MIAQGASVAIVIALGLGALDEEDSPPRKLSMPPIEAGIAREIERDRPGTNVVSVTCPEDVELRKGGTFTCRVRGSRPGEDAIAEVTQVDANGRVRYRVP